jgi:DNA-binding SARP family transcriptional activator/TolB-like protein
LAASAGDAGVSDERALALLWPDSDSARARNNLKQLVFTLRHALGREVFIRTATTLHLDRSTISVDRWDFERAVVEGDAAKAISIYSGPFLSGFHINGLPEFERWVEAGRERLAQAYMAALTSMATSADAAGDHLGAVAWWRKLVTEDPLNDLNAQKLISSLAKSGDTAGALQQARVHETLMALELDLKPSPAFQRFVQALRAGTLSAEVSTVRVTTPTLAVEAIAMAATVRAPLLQSGDGEKHSKATEEQAVQPVNPPSTRSSAATTPGRTRRAWRTAERRIAGFTTRFTVATMALVIVATVGAIAVRSSGSPFMQESGRGKTIVVLPFAFNAGSGSSNLGSMVSELLASSLDGSMGLRALAVNGNDGRPDSVRAGDSLVSRSATAHALATNLGAHLYVRGEVIENSDRLRITAEFCTRQNEAPLARADVEGTRGELFDLVDRVASQLLASRLGAGRRDAVR